MKLFTMIALSIISSVSIAQSNAFSIPEHKIVHEAPDAEFWQLEDGGRKKETNIPPPAVRTQQAKECDPALGDCVRQRSPQTMPTSQVLRAQPKSPAPVTQSQTVVKPVAAPPVRSSNTLPAPAPSTEPGSPKL